MIPEPPGTVVARVGLVSDTHAPSRCPELPQAMFDVLAGSDLILHAGDVGELWVLERLGRLAPVIAVQGNDESADALRVLPVSIPVDVGGVRLLLVHSHKLDPEEERAAREADDWPTILERRRELAEPCGADVVVYGHLHVPMTRMMDGVLLVNPGVVGHGHVVLRGLVRSVAVLFVLSDGSVRVVHADAVTGEVFDPEPFIEDGYWATMVRLTESIVEPSLGDWRTVWRALRDVAHQPTWDALSSLATECWTNRRELITADAFLEQISRDERVTPGVRRAYEDALTALATRTP